MQALLRILASAFLIVAVIAAVHDGTQTLATGRVTMTSIVEHWSRIAPGLLASAQSGVGRTLHPLVWSMGVRPLLQVPSWAVFAVLGFLCAYAGRRRRRVNVFAN